MKKLCSQNGFSLIEIMVAVMVLTVGLTGVALMQTTAIHGNSFAWNVNIGSNHSQEWMEWIIAHATRPNQDTILYLGHLQKENYVALSALDTDPTDDSATEVQLPSSQTTLLVKLGEKNFKNSDGLAFTAEQIPEPPGSGHTMFWRVMAERPIPNTTTIEIETRVKNAFSTNTRKVIRFIVSANM